MSRVLDKISIIQRFRIDAGHRLLNHGGKCQACHGHSYQFDVYLTAPELDSIGRIIDFSEVKNKIGGWLESNLDHGMIFNSEDPIAYLWTGLSVENIKDPRLARALEEIKGMKYFLLPSNPSAENLASYLKKVANELMLDTGIKVTKVICQETPNCSAFAE